MKRIAIFLVLGLLAAQVQADDFVTTFNSYFDGTVTLVQQAGTWTLNPAQSSDYVSGKVNILDTKNAFVQFDLTIKPEDVGPDGVDTESITFATYPRAGKSDVVAECRNTSWFNFSALASGKWESITDEVLPKDVFLKFFDENYLAKHGDEFPDASRPNGSPEIETPDVLTYRLDIPQIGTTTKLSVDGKPSADYPKRLNDLVNAVRFHTIQMAWDKERGVFRIRKVY